MLAKGLSAPGQSFVAAWLVAAWPVVPQLAAA
jgi:hypothetical protein